jgi:hypothetical protein
MKNNGYFLTYWNFLWSQLIKNSLVYRILCRIYALISNRWRTAVIPNLFRKAFFSGQAVRNSVAGKIFFSPFALVEWIQKKWGQRLNAQKENSFLVRSCKYYLHNLLALNLRFIGVFVASVSVAGFVTSLILRTSIRPQLFALCVGIVLMIFDVNLIDYLKDSIVVKLAEKCFWNIILL